MLKNKKKVGGKKQVQSKVDKKGKGGGDKRIPSDAPTALLEAVAKQDAKMAKTKGTKGAAAGGHMKAPASQIGKQEQVSNIKSTTAPKPRHSEHPKQESAKHGEPEFEDADGGSGCCLIF